MPMMAFIGVRISWLMLARKSLLAWVAASAAARACFNSLSARFRSTATAMVLAMPLRVCTVSGFSFVREKNAMTPTTRSSTTRG